MMKIEQMQISGFKSFSETTEVVFPDGITAVVGPNGCGKSNIGDAINWVLGEQSAKMLRGSSMQDVIFNGSEARKPQGMAEVSLHLAGRLSGDGEKKQISITRRLFRDGESDYLLNGAKSRLRDIQDLLREERVGAQTYATIEQGRIDQILNAKPKDRRLIIEEAAGIGGFKHKRRLAELKLEATHANLLRVNDIVTEVARQIGSLRRQAAKARRYGRLRDELRAKESVRFGAKARRLDAELARLREAEASALRGGGGIVGAPGDARSRASSRSGRRSRTPSAPAARATEALHQLELEIDRGEARVAACRDAHRRGGRGRPPAGRGHRGSGAPAGGDRRAGDGPRGRPRRGGGRAVRPRPRAWTEHRRLRRGKGPRRARRAATAWRSLRRGLFESMNRLAELRNRRRSIEEHLARLAASRERLEREREAAQGEHLRTSEEAAGLRERRRPRSAASRSFAMPWRARRPICPARDCGTPRPWSSSPPRASARPRRRARCARWKTSRRDSRACRTASVSCSRRAAAPACARRGSSRISSRPSREVEGRGRGVPSGRSPGRRRRGRRRCDPRGRSDPRGGRRANDVPQQEPDAWAPPSRTRRRTAVRRSRQRCATTRA